MACNEDLCKLRFDTLEKDVMTLKIETSDIALIKKDIADIKKILEKPTMRWELVINTIITSGVIYFFTQVFK